MQTTLLGAAIAIILVLVTALVGPLFVDWGRFRETFETKAQRLTGLEVTIGGPIEVRILPTPSLKLQKIEARRPGDAMPITARSMQIEFALDALMRGGLRVVNLTVERPQIAVGLDGSGRFAWPVPTIGFDPDALSIDRLVIDDGQIALSDARSGAGTTLEKVTFRGDLRSLVGPAKGDGAFVIGGQTYPYRFSTSRPAADGAVKLRLAVDSAEQPRMAELDGSVWIERGLPQFDATVQWAHGLGRSSAGTGEAWRLAGHLRGSSTTVAADKVEVQYGPEERAVRLHGDANLTLGRKPELSAMLSATQVDLDRVLGLPESVRRKPVVALRSLGDRFSGLEQTPIPMRLSVGIDAVTLAGGALQRLSGELHGEAGRWSLDALSFRAPGATQARLTGRLTVGPSGIDFAGPARIEAKDPRALVAWLTDHADAQLAGASFRAEGEVRLGTEAFAIDRLKADLDRMSLEGRFAYKWPAAGRPARVEAALSAPEVDFDRTYALLQDMAAGSLGGDAFAWPREGTLALNIAHSSVAGVAVQGADVDLRFDAGALGIERLAIADFGGATVAAKGTIDINAQTPRGAVTLDLDIRTPDGILALLDRAAPEAARELRRAPARFIPAKLTGSLAVDAAAAASSAAAPAPSVVPGPAAAGRPAHARFKIGGNAGTFAFNLEGDAASSSNAVSLSDLAQLAAARLAVTGQLSAQDGRALTDLLGLDRLVAAGKAAGRIDFKAAGALNDPMTVEARMTAEGLDVSADGSLRLPLGRAIAANLALAVAKADLRTARGTVPAAGTAQVAVSDDTVAFTRLNGEIAGANVTGRLAVGLAQPATLDGDLRLSKADLPALMAAVAGMPDGSDAGSAGPGKSLPSEPFGPGLFAAATGRIAVAAANAALTPRLTVRDLHGSVEATPDKVVLRDFAGALAGGTVSGGLELRRGPGGVAAAGNLKLREVEMAALMPGDGALTGRLALETTFEGIGRSPVALMGSLRGNGTFAAEHAAIARLDPKAFNPLVRSIDEGLPIEPARIAERLEAALAGGAFDIPRAEGTFTVAGGVLRLVDGLSGEGADLALTADIDLGARAMDATLTLTGPAGLGTPAIGRPAFEMVLQGPVDDPKRSFDVAALTNWLSSRAIALNGQRLEAAEAARTAPARDQARLEAEAQARAEQARAEQARAERARAEQARAEQAKAEQARAEQARAEQARAEQAKAEQARAEQARAEHARAEQARAEQAKAEQARAEQARAEQARAEQARAEQARAEQARAEQARAEQARVEQARAEQARADKAKADQARAEQAKAEQARAEQARAEQARAEQARAEQARAEQARAEQARAEQAKAAQAKADQARAEKARADQLRADRARAEALAMAEPGKTADPESRQGVSADPAIRALDQVIVANPSDANAFSRRGQLLVLRGEFSYAIRDFDEVLRLRPKDPEALNNRCWARAILGELQIALHDCNEALAIRPGYADAFDSRGFVNLKIGQPTSALSDYEAALRLNPRQASSLYGRGLAKVKTGKPADGQRDIAAAKALQSNIADEFANLGIR